MPKHGLINHTQWRLLVLPLRLLLAVLIAMTLVAVALVLFKIAPPHKTLTVQLMEPKLESRHNETRLFQFQVQDNVKESPKTRMFRSEIKDPSQVTAAPPAPPQTKTPESVLHLSAGGPYHDWDLFSADYEEMLHHLKIFVYPDVTMNNAASPFAHVFLPHSNLFDPKVGNYFSEHAFKVALLGSSLVTHNPEEAGFFFMPFSINAMRNDPRLHSEASIIDFVAQYTNKISWEFKFWNASRGADHFYICCHSIGREAASTHRDLHNNAIQVTCSSSYFQRFYVAHKDVGLPQVWPRPRQHEEVLNPPDGRNKLVFFAGRMQNSRIRQELMALWGNDTSMDINPSNFSYEVGFSRSRYCLHVKGYEVNTARISDAIHYGCIPVIISNYYDLPFANVLDWSRFSIIINEKDIGLLKNILLSVSRDMYLSMYQNLCMVRRHFMWHTTPASYDSFYMTAYQLWLRRGLYRVSSY